MLIVLFFIGYAATLFTYRLRGFSSDDPAPAINPVTFEQRKEFREFASLVDTGLHIKNFPTFDVSKNVFVVDAVLWFEFYALQLGLDIIDRFSIKNARIITKSDPNVKIVRDKLVVTYQLIFEMKSDLQFRKYPLTDHVFSIVLINNFVTPTEMYFDDKENSHSFSVSKKLFNSSWSVYSTKVQPGLIAEQPSESNKKQSVEIPCVVYSIFFSKSSFKDLLTLFMPIFAAGLFAWLSLLMNLSNEVGRFTLAVTGVTAILGYRFVIEQVSPQVGYFTVLDKFYLFLLSFCFSIFVFQLILTSYWYVLSKRIELEGDAKAIAASKEVHGDVLNKWMNKIFIVSALLMYGLTTYFLLY